MAYIGRGLDKISNIEHLDTITFDGSSSYSLTKNSVAFTPNSANSLQVSIDGVVQAGNFTVSGSTIDFGTAVPATSTNDFIFHYGTGVAFTPADGTVGTSQIADASITSAKLASGVGGKILQVVSATDSTERTTTSTSFVSGSTTLTSSITPSSASNKILIFSSFTGGNNTSGEYSSYTLNRGGTELSGSVFGMTTLHNGGSYIYGQVAMSYLDSPSTTSATTYTVNFRVSGGTGYINRYSTLGTLTLIEVSA